MVMVKVKDVIKFFNVDVTLRNMGQYIGKRSEIDPSDAIFDKNILSIDCIDGEIVIDTF